MASASIDLPRGYQQVLNYSPFDQEISKLQTEDLVRLKTVSEGWYVEYKAEEVSASNYAKALAAFANTYGGWLFIGVAEQSKDNPVAGRFPGIEAANADACLQRIRECASAHLQPTPHFESKTLHGPCTDLGLLEDRAVICIYVKESSIAPHIHKDGKIYRRVSDSSSPKPENDRHVLDQLYLRGKSIQKKVQRWISNDPEFSKGESEVPYLRLLFTLDPWMQSTPWVELSLSEVRRMMAAIESPLQAITFDSVHPTANGFIARQIMGNNPEHYGLSLKFGQSLSGELIVPLSYYRATDSEDFRELFSHYEFGEDYLDLLDEYNFRRVRILDLNFLLGVLVGFTMKYRALLRTAEDRLDFFVKAKVLNIWRHTPFLDVESTIHEFKNHGIPVCLDSQLTCPPGRSPDSFLPIENAPLPSSEHSEIIEATHQAMLIFLLVQNAMGISFTQSDEEDSSDPTLWTNLQAALRRAQKVQSERAKLDV